MRLYWVDISRVITFLTPKCTGWIPCHQFISKVKQLPLWAGITPVTSGPPVPHRPDVKAEIRARWIDDAGYLAGSRCGMGGKQVAVWASWWWMIFWYVCLFIFLNLLNSKYMCVYYMYMYLFYVFFYILNYINIFFVFFWNYVDTASTTLLLGCHGVTKKSWLHPQAWSLFQAPRLMSCVYLFIYMHVMHIMHICLLVCTWYVFLLYSVRNDLRNME